MKRNSTKGYIILGILFALMSVVGFAVPVTRDGAFWVAYAFSIIALGAQIFIWRTALGREDTLKSKFLGLPVVNIGTIYLVLQLIAFVAFLFIPNAPTWSAVIACGVILGISSVCMVAADAGRDEVEKVEEKVRKKVFYIKELQADMETLAENEPDAAIKEALGRLAEKIRFSDPMSNETLADLEEEIAKKVAELKVSDRKKQFIDEISSLLDERNKKCKLLK